MSRVSLAEDPDLRWKMAHVQARISTRKAIPVAPISVQTTIPKVDLRNVPADLKVEWNNAYSGYMNTSDLRQKEQRRQVMLKLVPRIQAAKAMAKATAEAAKDYIPDPAVTPEGFKKSKRFTYSR